MTQNDLVATAGYRVLGIVFVGGLGHFGLSPAHLTGLLSKNSGIQG